MRTNWMLVRSRYEFEAAAQQAGLRIVHVRAFSCFGNDPMGLDGPDSAARGHFHQVRNKVQGVLNSPMEESSKQFFIQLFADIERAMLGFAREHVPDVDMPSQKLVVLGR